MYQYANYLAQIGADVHVVHALTDSHGAPSRSPLKRMALRSIYSVAKRFRPQWHRLDRRVRVANCAALEAQAIPNTDVLIATSVRTAEFVSNLTRERGARGVYFIQGYEDYDAPAAYVDYTWTLPMRRIVVSDWLRAHADRIGVGVDVLPNGIDEQDFWMGTPVDRRPISLLGFYSDQPLKRSDLMVSAMTRIASRRPHARVVCFGTQRRPASLSRRIAYVRNPSRKTLAKLYRDSRVFVCTSDFEGFGLPVAEALACGTPVVSTRNGGVESFAREGTLFVDAGDLHSLVREIDLLLGDDQLSLRLSKAGHDLMRTHSLPQAARRFHALVTAGDE